jgi:hypothetical protein
MVKPSFTQRIGFLIRIIIVWKNILLKCIFHYLYVGSAKQVRD